MAARWPRPIRYAITAAILLAIAALFVQREFRADDLATTTADASLGLVDSAPLAIGAPAPDFVLETLDGPRVRLSDFRGKTVVLNFWASWCPPCREEMPELDALFRQRAARGDLVVLAVDFRPLDSLPEVRRFLRGYEEREGSSVAFPILFDTLDGAVAERYGVAPRGARQATLPVSFFIDRNGILRDRVFGPVFGALLPEKVAIADAVGR